MDNKSWDKHKSCSSHCCQIHGCKYSYEDCPVVTKKSMGVTGSCERCGLEDSGYYDQDIEETNQATTWEENKGFPKDCTREEWHKSSKFKTLRLMNNIIAEINQKTGQLYDLFQLLEDQYDSYFVPSDKGNLVERQLKILQLEATNLWKRMFDLDIFLTPNFTDLEFRKDNPIGDGTGFENQRS